MVALEFILALLCLSVAAKDHYFDGSAASNGDGSSSSPFNTLAGVRNLHLSPGDNILLRRGTKFTQALEIRVGGSATSPITIQPYGDNGSAPPVVAAQPEQLSSILIDSVSHIVVQDIEVTNRGDNKTARRGVYVYAKDAGEVRGITLRRLYIHNVEGYMPSTTTGGLPVGKYANASGGIVIEAAGNSTPTYFTDVLIEDNVIEAVGRQGIYTWTNWCRREALAQFWYSLCSQNWYPSTGLRIRGNRLYNISGDGIVVKGHVGALTEGNRVTTFNNGSGGNNAGIWAANSDGSVFRHNVVSGGKTTKDGMSYDVDHSTSGTIFEYNVSHDNEGGFFLLCPYDKPTRNFTIRYNLSVNDRARVFQICSGNLVGGKIYKNTVATGEGLSPQLVTAPKGLSLDVLFADNIIRKSGAGRVGWTLDSPQFNVTRNAFYGAIDTYPDAVDSVTAAPGLAAPGLRDPKAYRLLAGSPSLGSASEVSSDAQTDFFGNPTAAHKNLGFYSGEGTNVPQWISAFDDGSLSGWSTTGSVSVVADPAGDLGMSAQVAAGGKLARDVTSAPGLRLDARVRVSQAESGASVSLGTHSVSLGDIAPADVGVWLVLELTVTTEGASAVLDGQPVAVSTKAEGSGVAVVAGQTAIFVDDVFVAKL
ncbi:hypothetical protein JDV02_004050 [Purpureocillium takamizusanense]|uniref:Right handed beta helix domain-containing protein n=1 Tax=Purpureocillium takamizusanense TaxID=2060973 RepID=A0A9Q8QF08_9HYPO|nr:uncharacterized protein JDV02_004050 [Purpureocillium takamizusanense]UNI17729.1 hypothetical protein JDV02_004050 [Purpureocillium takamizusanense]